MTDGKYIKRSYEVEFRDAENLAPADDGLVYVEGHPIVFEQMTKIGEWFYETIKKDALDGADLSDVALYTNHDVDKIPLARCRKGRAKNSLEINIDERGLYFKAGLDVNSNQESAALVSAIKRGDVTGMSFAFTVDEDKWENLNEEIPVRTIEKIQKVFEISAVTYPAYAGTDIDVANRSRQLESDKAALESVKRNAQKQAEIETAKMKAEMLKQKIALM